MFNKNTFIYIFTIEHRVDQGLDVRDGRKRYKYYYQYVIRQRQVDNEIQIQSTFADVNYVNWLCLLIVNIFW